MNLLGRGWPLHNRFTISEVIIFFLEFLISISDWEFLSAIAKSYRGSDVRANQAEHVIN